MKSVVVVLICLTVFVSANNEYLPIVERLRLYPDKYPLWAREFPQTQRFNFPNQPLIVGGQIALPGQFKYQIGLSMQYPEGKYFCGGCLISQQYVLTAAHCVDVGIINCEVICGAHNISALEAEQIRFNVSPANIKLHENWSSRTLANDIALLKLPQKVTFNDRIHSVALLPKSLSRNTFAGLDGTTSGWGRYDRTSGISDMLRYVTTKLMTNADCRKAFGNWVQSTNICASGLDGKSSCNGDSGGPLTIFMNNTATHVGIVSFGSSSGCDTGFPHVYTRITEYIAWVEANSDAQFP